MKVEYSLIKKQWVHLFFLFLFASIGYWYFHAYFFLLLSFLFLLLPCLSFFATRHALLQLRLHFYGDAYKKRLEEEHISLHCENHFYLPLFPLEFTLCLNNTFLDETQKLSDTISLYPMRTEALSIPVDTTNLGRVHISVERLSYQELFGFFRFTCIPSASFDTTILPAPLSASPSDIPSNQGSALANELLSQNETSSGETVDLREYRGGDSLSRVHWKLSGKYETLMVRVFDEAASGKISVAIDLYNQKINEEHCINLFLEEVCTALLILLSKHYEIHAACPSLSNNKLLCQTICNSSDVSLFFQKLLWETAYDTHGLVRQFLNGEEEFLPIIMTTRKESSDENTFYF